MRNCSTHPIDRIRYRNRDYKKYPSSDFSTYPSVFRLSLLYPNSKRLRTIKYDGH